MAHNKRLWVDPKFECVTVTDPEEGAAAEDQSAEQNIQSLINKMLAAEKNISICWSLGKEGQVVTVFHFMVPSRVNCFFIQTAPEPP